MRQPPTSAESEGAPFLPAFRRILRWDNPEPGRVRGWIRSLLKWYLEWNRKLLLDPWLRYQPVIAILRSSGLASNVRILDVGSGSVGLGYFLRRPVVAADLEFSNQDMLTFRSPASPIRASATHLPFRDASFDAVVSMDMIEHLDRTDRPSAISELLRVSGPVLVLGFPFGERSAEHDRNALAIEAKNGISLAWREEHVRNGLPDDRLHGQLLELARTSVPKRNIRWFGHETLVGLRLRWKLQLLLGSESRLRGLLIAPLYWFHARGRHDRTYRRVYVIQGSRVQRPR